MKWETVRLELGEAEIEGLKLHNAKLMKHLEDGFPLRVHVLAGLKDWLMAIINKNGDFLRVMEGNQLFKLPLYVWKRVYELPRKLVINAAKVLL